MKKVAIKLNKNGFTLIEAILVIAILAILVLIAVPQFDEVVRTQKLDSTLQQIETNFKYAQQMAVYDGENASVVFSDQGGQLVCYVKRGTSSQKDKKISLDGSFISYGIYSGGYSKKTGDFLITFKPNRMPSNPMTVGLETTSGQIKKFAIAVATGKVRQY